MIKRHYESLKNKAERQNLLQQVVQASASEKAPGEKLELLLNLFLEKEQQAQGSKVASERQQNNSKEK